MREAASGIRATPDDLNEYAWELLTCEPDALQDSATALEFAKRAVLLTGSRHAGILDTLALAYHRTGDHANAVATQEKALSLLPSSTEDPGVVAARKEFTERLEEFRAAAADSPTDEPTR